MRNVAATARSLGKKRANRARVWPFADHTPRSGLPPAWAALPVAWAATARAGTATGVHPSACWTALDGPSLRARGEQRETEGEEQRGPRLRNGVHRRAVEQHLVADVVEVVVA